METKRDLQNLHKRYERLAARLAKVGLIVQGTITQRIITKRDPDDATRIKKIGPYYQWTFKRDAKTVTVNLAAAQAKPFQRAIDTNRKLEALVTRMRDLARQLLEATTRGVQRCKPRAQIA